MVCQTLQPFSQEEPGSHNEPPHYTTPIWENAPVPDMHATCFSAAPSPTEAPSPETHPAKEGLLCLDPLHHNLQQLRFCLLIIMTQLGCWIGCPPPQIRHLQSGLHKTSEESPKADAGLGGGHD